DSNLACVPRYLDLLLGHGLYGQRFQAARDRRHSGEHRQQVSAADNKLTTSVPRRRGGGVSHRRAVSSLKTRAKIASTLRRYVSSAKVRSISAGARRALISSSARTSARKSAPSSHARIALRCTHS